MKAILGLFLAAALAISVHAGPVQAGPGVAVSGQASSGILASSPGHAGLGSQAGSAVIRVREGCGPGFHRNYEGRCRPNGWERERERRFERLECPRGYHLSRDGRRCWPS